MSVSFSKSTIPLPHTRFIRLKDARVVGRPRGSETIQVTVVLRHLTPTPDLHDDPDFSRQPPGLHKYLRARDFASKHGAHPDDADLVSRFARKHHLRIAEVSLPWRSVVLKGTCADFSRAFGVEMVHYDHPRGFHRGIIGSVHVPAELRKIVRTVFGLHNRPCIRRHSIGPLSKPGLARELSVLELADVYSFPKLIEGVQRVGLIEFGGGYHRSDLAAFFSSLKLPVPKIADTSVDGARNAPADPSAIRAVLDAMENARTAPHSPASNSPSKAPKQDASQLEAVENTIETTMDIQILGALAGEAELSVFFAPNTEQGVFNALRRAMTAGGPRPNILSISWGEPEPGLTASYLNAVNDLLRDAAHLGITVCASSGDSGGLNQSPDGKPAVSFPASSPYVLGCGGTTPRLSGARVASEIVWNSIFCGHWGATGGGVSRHFGLPPWQEKLAVPAAPNGFRGRGVPDVAGPADPNSGCRITVGGTVSVSGGTSAVAPFWAGLLARVNRALGAGVGYLTPYLYHRRVGRDGLFREVSAGNNGAYAARPDSHWNACTGLGSPHGERILSGLQDDA